MKDIIKIVLEGASGYGCVDEAYEDKLTITPASVSYEYKPHPESQSETNCYRKWSYKTNSPIFQELYRQATEMTFYFFREDRILDMADDAQPTRITVTYEDKHRENITYWGWGDGGGTFIEYFKVIRQMIPSCEYMPAVLLLDEDYKDDKDSEGEESSQF